MEGIGKRIGKESGGGRTACLRDLQVSVEVAGASCPAVMDTGMGMGMGDAGRDIKCKVKSNGRVEDYTVPRHPSGRVDKSITETTIRTVRLKC